MENNNFRMPRPTATGLFLCHGVKFEQINGQDSLERIFFVLGSKEYPSVIEEFYLYAVLTGGRGSHEIKAKISNVDPYDEILWSESCSVIFRNPLGLAAVAFLIKNLWFPKPGVYTASYSCGQDQNPIVETRFRMQQITQE